MSQCLGPFQRVLLLFLVCFSALSLQAQTGFERHMEAGLYTMHKAVEVDSAGNIYIASEVLMVTQERFAVLRKLNPNGQLIWQRVVTRINGLNMIWKEMEIAPNGRIYLLGEFNNFGILLTCFDAAGNLLFFKRHDFSDSGIGFTLDRDMTRIGSQIYMTGLGSQGLGLTRAGMASLDLNGDMVWSKFYDSNVNTEGKAICESVDANVLLAGDMMSSDDIWVAKMTTQGNQIWLRRYEFIENAEVSDIIATADNGALITGNYFVGGVTTDLGTFITKIDNNGNEEWTREIRTKLMFNVQKLKAYGDRIYLMGRTADGIGAEHQFVMQMDNVGNEIQTVNLSRTMDFPRDIDFSPTGTLVSVGQSTEDVSGFFGSASTADSNLFGFCFSELMTHDNQVLTIPTLNPNWNFASLNNASSIDSLQSEVLPTLYTSVCAPADTFSCDRSLFHHATQQNPLLSTVFELNAQGGSSTNTVQNTLMEDALTLGYNVRDNLLYSIHSKATTGEPSLHAYNKQGELVYGSKVDGLPDNLYKSLDVSEDGLAHTYHVGNQRMYVIDTKQRPFSLVDSFDVVDPNGATTYEFDDISFHRSTGNLYGVHYRLVPNSVEIYQIDPQNSAPTLHATYTGLSSVLMRPQTSFFGSDSTLLIHCDIPAGSATADLISCNIYSGVCTGIAQMPESSNDGCSCIPPLLYFEMSNDSACFGDTVTISYYIINTLDTTLTNVDLVHHFPTGFLLASAPSQLLGGSLVNSPIGSDSLRIEDMSIPPDTSIITISLLDTFSIPFGQFTANTKAFLLGLAFRDSIGSDNLDTPQFSDSSSLNLEGVFSTSGIADTTICKGDTITIEVWDFQSFILGDYSNMVDSTDSIIRLFSLTDFGFNVDFSRTFCRIQDSIEVVVNAHGFELPADTLVCDQDSFAIQVQLVYDEVLWSDASMGDELVVGISGMYSAIATDSIGCVNADSIVVRLNTSPELLEDSVFISCPADSFILDFPSINAWYTLGAQSDSFQIVQRDTGRLKLRAINECNTREQDMSFAYQAELSFGSLPDTTVCAGTDFEVSLASNALSVRWQDGDTVVDYTVDTAGFYWVEYITSCQQLNDSFEVSYFDIASSITIDTTFCGDQFTYTFDDSLEVFDEFEMPVTNRVIVETEEIAVWYIDACGFRIEDTLRVTIFPSIRPFIPTAFSPDGNQVNDTWEVDYTDPRAIRYTVFNRWGDMIWTGGGFDAWDGTKNGNPLPAGIYALQLEYKTCLGQETIEQHFIHLVR